MGAWAQSVKGVIKMAYIEQIHTTLMNMLWQSLEGGDYDLEALQQNLKAHSEFAEFGVDSLEFVDFIVRIEDHFNISIPQEEYANLGSISAMQAYLQDHAA